LWVIFTRKFFNFTFVAATEVGFSWRMMDDRLLMNELVKVGRGYKMKKAPRARARYYVYVQPLELCAGDL
jgi:hypothetical protein